MIWPFKRKQKPGTRTIGGSEAQELINAAQTMVVAAMRYGATRLRQELIGFGKAGEARADWIVEARRKDAKDFLIWSEEHRGWWAPNRSGYVKERAKAGRYSFDDAVDIVKGANINKRDVPNEGIVFADDEV